MWVERNFYNLEEQMVKGSSDKAIEYHPWNHFIPENARTLIIGTFPTALRNWSFDFFYPNKRNLLWKILADINGTAIINESGENAVSERKAILTSLRVGVTDMGKCIERNGGSSLDEQLCLKEAMDILALLESNPTIKRLILTSSSGPVSALKWFMHYLKGKGIAVISPKGKKPLYFKLKYGDINVDVHILYSPSPRASNRISFPVLTAMYKSVINA